ncbi:lysozyme inhibitor LprI family protein [Variovorax sp. Sphag1AA]|uniref:lysozyme inhibitor LprI family protein n=1 Tax=Variovorax sp. Sphag1AA TaxID=2587027 RepID=UPI00160CE9CA|nr:lysozyme inhibitor LprI family protein [Variovorax sp. Sphag1AA]MBB3180232.1 uncharacterized protein YecT (DUF1311 family) [Variovorax sp. Sphag1AA]
MSRLNALIVLALLAGPASADSGFPQFKQSLVDLVDQAGKGLVDTAKSAMTNKSQDPTAPGPDLSARNDPQASLQPTRATAPGSPIAASFDCRKAATASERIICSNPQAAESDRDMASAFGLAMQGTSNPSRIQSNQREWIAKVRNACQDAQCVISVNGDRAAALRSLSP